MTQVMAATISPLRTSARSASGQPAMAGPPMASTSRITVAWSLDDRIFPLAHGHRLAKLLPQGRPEVIDDAGAFIPEDQPERLAALIGGFISETVAKPGPPNEVTASGMGRQ